MKQNKEILYQINCTQLSCINILIRTLQEAINRNCFNEKEIEKIKKTIDLMNSN